MNLDTANNVFVLHNCSRCMSLPVETTTSTTPNWRSQKAMRKGFRCEA